MRSSPCLRLTVPSLALSESSTIKCPPSTTRPPRPTSSNGRARLSILISGCAILDETQPDGYLSSQNILIEGNRISKITSANIPEEGIDRVLEGKDRLAIPGLINAHTHSLENFSKATKEKMPLELWLLDLFLLGGFSPREIYLAAMLGAMEMLKTGTTAVLDHLALGNDLTAEALDAAMQAYADSGIRGGVAPLIQDDDQVMRAAVAARPGLRPLLGEKQERRTAPA